MGSSPLTVDDYHRGHRRWWRTTPTKISCSLAALAGSRRCTLHREKLEDNDSSYGPDDMDIALLMWQKETNGQRGNRFVTQDRWHQQKGEPNGKTLYVAWRWLVTCCYFVLVPLRCGEIIVQFRTTTYGPRGLQPIPIRLCAQVWSCLWSRNRGTCSCVTLGIIRHFPNELKGQTKPPNISQKQTYDSVMISWMWRPRMTAELLCTWTWLSVSIVCPWGFGVSVRSWVSAVFHK